MAIDLRDLERLIADKDFKGVRAELSVLQDADIALFMEELQREHVVMVFRSLPKDRAAEIFSYLSSDMQQYIVEAITDQEVSSIINDLYLDDAADFLEEMPANVVKRVLRNASPEVRELINHFLKYPPHSAGSIMTAEFVDLRKTMRVSEAFQRIRRTAIDKETVYTCYVMDDNRRLEGVVTVRELFLADDDDIIGDIMEKNVIAVRTTEDQEEVAALLSHYNFISLPVVDEESRLVGIVTFDDVMEVIHQEATEDFQKMAAMAPSDKPYLKTSVFTLAKNRIVWLMILMLSATITGSILGKYEAAFISLPVLITFIPMLTDTGGNVGSQSSTLIIRGMALNELDTKDVGRILRKELSVSALMGAVLSGANFLRIILLHPGSYTMALAVSLALYATVMLAATIGSMLPLAARALKSDPAVMAAPVVTTLVDATSLIIYSKIVDLLL
ncbi:magnesium transporter [Candidatus Darwinibacter acetoxidans]